MRPLELLQILAQIYMKTLAPSFDKSIATDFRLLEDYGAETQSMVSLYPPKYKNTRSFMCEYTLVRVNLNTYAPLIFYSEICILSKHLFRCKLRSY